MNGAAHVEAAGQGDAHLGGQLVGAEILEEIIHDGLHHARRVDGGRVAVGPALGVDDVGDAVAGPADGEPVAAAPQVVQERLQLGLVADQEFHVVAG
ncbi:MAG: hypothetical protein MUC41_19360, partial [Syntrophobacteraceae bacterium]|nr:hypothetical protein [Syntrophobacteraceae bacterium]